MKIAVTVNGKMRAMITVSSDTSEDRVQEAARTNADVQSEIGSRGVKKVIFIPGRSVHITTK